MVGAVVRLLQQGCEMPFPGLDALAGKGGASLSPSTRMSAGGVSGSLPPAEKKRGCGERRNTEWACFA